MPDLEPELTPMTFTAERRGAVLTLTVAGEVDLVSVNELRADINLSEIAFLVLDLTQVTFIDSTGVHLLIEYQHRMERAGGRLVIVCDGGPVRRILDVCGLEGRLPLVEEHGAWNGAASPEKQPHSNAERAAVTPVPTRSQNE